MPLCNLPVRQAHQDDGVAFGHTWIQIWQLFEELTDDGFTFGGLVEFDWHALGIGIVAAGQCPAGDEQG